MTTTVIAGNQRTKVIRRDRRDGADILLLCEELELPSGITIESDDDEWYPMDNAAADETPVLEIYTRSLSGRWHSNFATFASQATSLTERGYTSTEITPENAAEWGLVRADGDPASPRTPPRRFL